MTQVAVEPMTVGQLEARLRRLLGRLGSRDKQTILLAIEAIEDLSKRLHQEQQKTKQATVRFERPTLGETMRALPQRTAELRHADGTPLYPNVSTRPACPHCGVSLSGGVEHTGETVCPHCARASRLNATLSAVVPKLEDLVALQQRVDDGELLSDREDDQLHTGYDAWRQRRVQTVNDPPDTWDAFIAALRALYKDKQDARPRP